MVQAHVIDSLTSVCPRLLLQQLRRKQKHPAAAAAPLLLPPPASKPGVGAELRCAQCECLSTRCTQTTLRCLIPRTGHTRQRHKMAHSRGRPALCALVLLISIGAAAAQSQAVALEKLRQQISPQGWQPIDTSKDPCASPGETTPGIVCDGNAVAEM